ncbi:phosphoinositide phosphatase SAC2-like isoform X2 [Rutidosis leptorrhynchoides]|uniref:phosphoinositide phosphatase SAC2-like isoform X2 n=1 Tax=Rutidosis leptorrhynchoides TaxID=125765 RepID=UPI003A9A46EB
MAAASAWIRDMPKLENAYLHKFKLYETISNYYMIGHNKNRSIYRVLKIDRSEAAELNITEDSTVYTERESNELIRRIDYGNKSTGGFKSKTVCYGVVGFIKFLGPYYMLLITKRKKIGVICGHAVYAIMESEIFPISNSTVAPNMDYSKNENRYLKLLRSVDLRKDFYFSYTYHVMHSLQKNLSTREAGQDIYETMFVWNEFLTSAIRNQLNNNLWTVPLVYGHFKQVKLLLSEKEFMLTIIARRSRHYAGTRYLKRGVNEDGCVANDVETEQLVFEDNVPEGYPVQISSIVQNRGSIPLFWSQETSRLNMKPDIILSKQDNNYEATRLHFQNLYERYGNPIIILNLVKTTEKKPRESILRVEFANAIESINKGLPRESQLKFLHWDLNKHSRKSSDVLVLLGKVATYALNLTGFFYCQVTSRSKSQELMDHVVDKSGGDHCLQNHASEKSDGGVFNDILTHDSSCCVESSKGGGMKAPQYQTGVLRTNCIDCLDRTNVAQYAYGWAALGHQLHALGYIDTPSIELDSSLADDLMSVYERMGDTLALQYGGSAAHNKIFSQRRGQWKAATQSQEFFRTLQRYYSNAYMDAQKQDAINLFLGHYRPRHGTPALWELDSNRHYYVGSRGLNSYEENTRGVPFSRSLSDGNIMSDGRAEIDIGHRNEGECENSYSREGEAAQEDSRNGGLSESSPEISTCERDSSYPRYRYVMPAAMSRRRHLYLDTHAEDYPNSDCIFYYNNKRSDSFNCSNFIDVDWISSSGNSCEGEAYERSLSPFGGQSSENVVNGGPVPCDSELCLHPKGEDDEAVGKLRGGEEYPDEFVEWVMDGGMFFRRTETDRRNLDPCGWSWSMDWNKQIDWYSWI